MSEPIELCVLIAPVGQLTGNGQLRESMSERRSRKGENYPMWYLSPALAIKFKLTNREGYEAVIAEDYQTITWLKLRFGGQRSTIKIDTDLLWELASEIPEADKRRDISFK